MSRARAFALTDVAFHRVLTAIPGNPIFLAAHEALVEWLINQRIHMANTELENRIRFAGHKAGFEAIERHDPEAAGQAMREHLENAR
ncbi:FCD domain-containing protein, partial [Mesorhizobium sp. M2D.F.Ca.ET.148.01.1.1]|uniref:FCD domain-containing protein n=1 Tax=Mesorhizobium sp. M2D.F.Ca.ET.148.01.1.1 TaxID=2496665 RepID=UPI001FDF91EC